MLDEDSLWNNVSKSSSHDCASFLTKVQEGIVGSSNPLQTVYNTVDDVLISVYKNSLAVFPGSCCTIEPTTSMFDGSLNAHSSDNVSPKITEKTTLRPLCRWEPTEDDPKQSGFFDKVGAFTCIAINPSGNFVFVGTEQGCVVVFTLTIETCFTSNDKSQGLPTKDTAAGATLRPLMWSNLQKHIEIEPSLEHEEESLPSPVVISLDVCSAEAEGCSIVAVLLSCGYLAVLEVDSESGAVPIDVIHIPTKMQRVAIIPVGIPHAIFWKVDVAVAGSEAVFIFQATRECVVLTQSVDVETHRTAFAEIAGSPGTTSNPQADLVALKFQDDLETSSEVLAVWRVEGVGGNDILELITIHLCSHICRIERTGIDGLLTGLTFIMGEIPLSSFLSTLNPYKSIEQHITAICLTTNKSIELLSIPELFLLHRFHLPEIQETVFTKQIELYNHSFKNILSDKENNDMFGAASTTDEACHENTMTRSLQHLSAYNVSFEYNSNANKKELISGPSFGVTICSTITRDSFKKKNYEDAVEEVERGVMLEATSPLAFISLPLPLNNGETEVRSWICWLLRRDFVPYGRGRDTDDSVTPAVFSTDPQERVSQIKHQIELAIQRSKQEQKYSLDPDTLLTLFRTLISLSDMSSLGASQPRNIFPYIANVAKFASFNCLSNTRRLLTGAADLLLSAETSGVVSDTNRGSILVLKALQRLATFELLNRINMSDEDLVDILPTVTTGNPSDITECLNDNVASFDWSSWNRFLKADLGKMCCNLASSSELTKFFIIFNRHVTDFDKDKDICSDKVMKILLSLPVKLPSPQFEPLLGDWIRGQIIPFLKNSCPFIEWLCSRALGLEAVWGDPLPALGFLRSVFPNCIFTDISQRQPLATSDKECRWVGGSSPLPVGSPLLPGDFTYLSEFWSGCGSILGDLSTTLFPEIIEGRGGIKRRSVLQRLMRIYCLLNECAHIFTQHDLRIRVSDLDNGRLCWTDIAYELLNRVRLHELLADEVRVHVGPFCQHHGLNKELLLLSYIYDIVGEIDADLISAEDGTTNNILGRELRAVALIHCLEEDESKAKALLWLLHAWSPVMPPTAPSSLGLSQIVAQLQTSKSLMGHPILIDLQSAMTLRDLQGLLNKYNIRASISIMSKPSEARILITHLASLILWGATSFSNALTAVQLLKPLRATDIDEVAVAMIRVQTMVSASNRKLLSQVASGIRVGLGAKHTTVSGHVMCIDSKVGGWSWKDYDPWEASWKPGFLRSIKETVVSHLTFKQLNALCTQFTNYAFFILDEAADELQPLNSSISLTPDKLLTAAESILVSLAAIFLIQHITATRTTEELHNGSYHIACHNNAGRQSIRYHLGRPSPLEVLQRCERLRREFGIFVKPSQLSRVATGKGDGMHQKTISPFCQNKLSLLKHIPSDTENSLFYLWKSTINNQSLDITRRSFLCLGGDKINEVVEDLRILDTHLQLSCLTNNHLTEVSNGKPIGKVHESGLIRTTPSGSKFTQLLQFGVLMGVGESYVRQSVVRPQNHKKQQLDLPSLRRLLADCERNPSPENTSDIIKMLRNLISQLYITVDDPRLNVSLLVCLSQILEVSAHCLKALPANELQQGIEFSTDILLALQLLVQSDLLDTTVDLSRDVSPRHSSSSIKKSGFIQNSSMVGFSTFAKAFLPCLAENRLNEDLHPLSKMPLKNRHDMSTLVTRGHSLFTGRFRGLSALYRKREAVKDAMEILKLKQHIYEADTLLKKSNIQTQLMTTITEVVDKLLDLESYDLAITFLLRFPGIQHNLKLKEAAAHLLAKVTASRESFDFELGAGLSLLLGRSEVWRRFLDAIPTIREVSRVLFYSRLVMDIGILLQVPYLVKNTAQIWIRAKWRQKLDYLGCHYDAKRFQEVQEQPGIATNLCQKELLPHLLTTASLNLTLAREFARDFEIEEVDVLSLWLKLVLVNLPLCDSGLTKLNSYNDIQQINRDAINYDEDDDSNTDKLSYKQLTLPVLYGLCKEKTETILEDECLPQISPYDYDRIEFLLSWISHRPIARAGLVIIHYIHSYRRTQPSSLSETLYLEKRLSRSLTYEEQRFQKERLPFHQLLEDPWTVLGPVVTDTTIKTFMPLYPLKLRRDDFQLQLLWNFVEDLRDSGISGIKSSRWILNHVVTRSNGNGTNELINVSDKLKQLLDGCFTVRPKRALAAALLFLDNHQLLPIGELQVAVAEWTSSHIPQSQQKTDTTDQTTTSESYIFSVDWRQGLPPHPPQGLQDFLLQKGLIVSQVINYQHTNEHLEQTTDINYNSQTTIQQEDTEWLVTRTKEQAAKEAGMLRSKWALMNCHLGQFADLLPDCSLLCIHALYYYLAPILLRPVPIGLESEDQLKIFMALSQYPLLHIPLASQTFNTTTTTTTTSGTTSGTTVTTNNKDNSDDINCQTRPPSEISTYTNKITLHDLVGIISLSCNFNPKTVKLSILRRLLKTPFWTPLNAISLLEKNMAMYQDQDIIGMIGCVPSPQILSRAKKILEIIEISSLTKGFEIDWYDPFKKYNTNGRTLTTHIGLTLGQSKIELISKQRQFLIASGLDTRLVMKLVLETALKNDRIMAKSSRGLSLGYTSESTEVIHTFYKESPENTLQFWRHSLYLDSFDYLGIASQLGNFIKADKAGLVRAFWRESRSSLTTDLHHGHLLILIGSLYLDFNLQDSRLFARVLHKILLFARTTPHNCFSHWNKPILNDSNNSFPTAVYLTSFLCSTILQGYATGDVTFPPPDTELLSVLHDIFMAPAMDLLNTLKRVAGNGSNTNGGTLESPSGSLEWFLLVPALLHRSPFSYYHQTQLITRHYFELSHYLYYLQSRLNNCSQTQNERSTECILTTTSLWTRGKFAAQNTSEIHTMMGVTLEWLAQLDIYLCKSHYLRSLFDSLGLLWILNIPCHYYASQNVNSHLIQQPIGTGNNSQSTTHRNLIPSNTQEDTNNFDVIILIRLQLICSCIGLQCLDNSFEQSSNETDLLHSFSHDLRGCSPSLLFLLTEAEGKASMTYHLSLSLHIAQIIAIKEELCQQTQQILNKLKLYTPRNYGRFLNVLIAGYQTTTQPIVHKAFTTLIDAHSNDTSIIQEKKLSKITQEMGNKLL